MPADMRKELEAAADKSGKSVTQELLRRLQDSFHRDRDKSRDPAMRALCFLFGEIAKYISWPPFVARPWRSNPFLFTAFKLAVGKLLDSLKPVGEIESALIHQPGDFYRRIYESPETLSDYVASIVWAGLHRSIPPSEIEELVRKFPEIRGTWDQELYGMLDARRDLGIKLQGEKP
jgi:Arc-like DNA binding domain